MTTRTVHPFRPCDLCGRTRAAKKATRPARRAWTLYHHSGLLACPACAARARAAEDATCRALFGRAEPPLAAEPHGDDPPLRKTHRIRLAGSTEELDVHRDGGRFYALDGTWDLPVNDDRITVVLKRYTQHDANTSMAAEPLPGERPRDQRFRTVEGKLILARLNDIAVVLRRHHALSDALPPDQRDLPITDRVSIASNNLYTRIQAIRAELSLRTVWISHTGFIICRIGGAMCKFLPEELPALLAATRRHYNGRLWNDLKEPRLPAHCNALTPDDMLACAEHNAAQARASGTPAMAREFDEMLRTVRAHFGVGAGHCG